jgi:gliding motility-associated-like protein
MPFTSILHRVINTKKLALQWHCVALLGVLVCSYSAEASAQSAITIPNTFTPNADLVNDEFTIDLSSYTVNKYEISVFNRWGELMFVSKHQNIHWDGRTAAGIEASAGIYFYILYVNDQPFSGSLILIR